MVLLAFSHDARVMQLAKFIATAMLLTIRLRQAQITLRASKTWVGPGPFNHCQVQPPRQDAAQESKALLLSALPEEAAGHQAHMPLQVGVAVAVNRQPEQALHLLAETCQLLSLMGMIGHGA